MLTKEGEVITIKKNEDIFYQICAISSELEAVYMDNTLSLQAKGLFLTLFLSKDLKPMTKTQIKTQASNGAQSFQSAFTELETKKYIKPTKITNRTNQITGWTFF